MGKPKYKTTPEMEGTWDRPKYKEGDIEDLYELNIERRERVPLEERPEPEERVIREVVIRKRGLPRMEDAEVKPLKLLGTEIVGSLFDRIQFLGMRIKELTEALKIRDQLHVEIAKEIDEDIRDKTQIMNKLADIDERRNFKLDISILRKEKRLENVQYWRDLVELREQLREQMEKYETEKKIVDIFKELEPEGLT